MKIKNLIMISAIGIFCLLFLNVVDLLSAPLLEDEAVGKAAGELYENSSRFKGKKISVYIFTNLDGKETEEGKRISQKFLSKMIVKKDFKFVERAEIDKIIKEHELQQTGAVDTESIIESGGVLPVDVMINGTIAQNNGLGEIHVKAVDVSSGEIYAISIVGYKPGKDFSYVENQDKLKQYKKSPERFDKVNNSIAVINNMSTKAPFVFMIVTADESDIRRIKNENPRMLKNLNQKKENMKNNNPARWRNLMRLRENMNLIKEDNPEAYAKIMEKKNELIVKGIEKKRRPRIKETIE